MSSPRKFAEKIALLQQKQAEGDAAFNNILDEVEAAKQVRLSLTKPNTSKMLFFVVPSSMQIESVHRKPARMYLHENMTRYFK